MVTQRPLEPLFMVRVHAGQPLTRIVFPMALTVRRLVPADLDALVPLFGAYLDFYFVARRPADEKSFLENRIASNDSTALGAFEGPTMAGFALCHHTWNSLRLAPAWILHDLFVDPDHRRRGVARELLRAVRRTAGTAGACEVVLGTAHTNSAAQALYEREGYHLDTVFRVYVLDLQA